MLITFLLYDIRTKLLFPCVTDLDPTSNSWALKNNQLQLKILLNPVLPDTSDLVYELYWLIVIIRFLLNDPSQLTLAHTDQASS